MKAAGWPRNDAMAERLLWIDPIANDYGDASVADLRALPARGDLLVVNDAATLPGSLRGHTEGGSPIEIRLAAFEGGRWKCVLFGAGDWHTRTEDRPAPPAVSAGSVLRFDGDLSARVEEVLAKRLLLVAFDRQDDAFWEALYRHGRPVQYAHVRSELSLFHVQTSYASRPWAAEMPSAGRPLTGSLLAALRANGVGIAYLTHAAGLSSTGDAKLDATLPWPERFDIPATTVDAIAATRRSGGRVIAVGTSVARALEGAAREYGLELAPGEGTTDLVLGPDVPLHVVGGLLTGLHEASATHFSLLQAFVKLPLLAQAYAHAERSAYRGHEFGDSCLILGGVSSVTRCARGASPHEPLRAPHRE